MRIHYLQHSPSEGLGEIEPWARTHGHTITATQFHLGQPLPALEDIDWLIVMGGPMNIYEHRNHPWLVREKEFITQAIAAGKIILGICLGAQLIADCLGSKVYQNPEIEIGWLPVQFTAEAQSHPLLKHFPQTLAVLHWHGDTFSIPTGATNFAFSAACPNQAYVYGDRIVGLQFHLEVGQSEVTAFLAEDTTSCGDSLGDGTHIQTRSEIASGASTHLPVTHKALEGLLSEMAKLG